MRSKKCHELDSGNSMSRAVPHKAIERDALTQRASRATVTRAQWNEVQHRRRDDPNCENYKEWIYLLILVVPLV